VATTLLVPGLFWLGLLPAWLLLVVVTLSGLSLPLSASGARSLLPLLLPRSMWDRGNGLDSASWRAAAICGPALAGALVAAFGSSPTMVAVAATWVLAGALLIGLREPRTGLEGARSLLGDALAGLRYLLGNRVLRRLGVVFPINTLSPGALSIALPLLVFTRFHGNAALVGLLWAAMGAGGLAGKVLKPPVSVKLVTTTTTSSTTTIPGQPGPVPPAPGPTSTTAASSSSVSAR